VDARRQKEQATIEVREATKKIIEKSVETVSLDLTIFPHPRGDTCHLFQLVGGFAGTLCLAIITASAMGT